MPLSSTRPSSHTLSIHTPNPSPLNDHLDHYNSSTATKILCKLTIQRQPSARPKQNLKTVCKRSCLEGWKCVNARISQSSSAPSPPSPATACTCVSSVSFVCFNMCCVQLSTCDATVGYVWTLSRLIPWFYPKRTHPLSFSNIWLQSGCLHRPGEPGSNARICAWRAILRPWPWLQGMEFDGSEHTCYRVFWHRHFKSYATEQEPNIFHVNMFQFLLSKTLKKKSNSQLKPLQRLILFLS